MSLTRVGAAVLLTLLVSSSRRCASQQPPGVTGASRPNAAPADGELAAVSARIRARIERLLARTQPELYRTHLESVLALIEADRLKLRFAGAYPLHVQLHGNGPSLPTAYVSFVVGPHQQYETQG